jgi:hypothetical protein
MKTLFADVQLTGSGRLFVQGQEYTGSFYTVTCRYNSFLYTAPVENYRLILDPDGTGTTLKILAAGNADLLKKYISLTCINNG